MNKRILIRYTLFGVCFGCVFPIVATITRILQLQLPVNLVSVSLVQQTDYLLWIIDTAPFFLGLFAFFIGMGQAKASSLNQDLHKANNQLQDARQQLEEELTIIRPQLSAYTQMLELSAEVSRRLSTILDTQELVKAVVDDVQQAFRYYHTHIYLFDEMGENLVMVGGTGEAGQQMLARGHKIPKGRGLVGKAAESGEAVLVADTLADPNWLLNPLLPETRSEVAVPMFMGKKVLGVLDVQQNLLDGLTELDVNLLRSIAGQVAVALHNARQYDDARRQAERETRVNLIGQKVQQTLTIEDALQVALRELSLALDAPRASIQVGMRRES